MENKNNNIKDNYIKNKKDNIKESKPFLTNKKENNKHKEKLKKIINKDKNY